MKARTMKIRTRVRRDEVGYYAVLEEDGIPVRETLRTGSYEKAERWKIQGDCHGWKMHHEPCRCCRNT